MAGVNRKFAWSVCFALVLLVSLSTGHSYPGIGSPPETTAPPSTPANATEVTPDVSDNPGQDPTEPQYHGVNAVNDVASIPGNDTSMADDTSSEDSSSTPSTTTTTPTTSTTTTTHPTPMFDLPDSIKFAPVLDHLTSEDANNNTDTSMNNDSTTGDVDEMANMTRNVNTVDKQHEYSPMPGVEYPQQANYPGNKDQSNTDDDSTSSTESEPSVQIDDEDSDDFSDVRNRDKPVFLSQLSFEKARQRSEVDLEEMTHESHAGFITVDEDMGNHLFFWLVKAKLREDLWGINKAPETAPLLLWINGGPGVSAMTGFLTGHGPYGLKMSHEEGKRVEVFQREHSWTNSCDVLFVDGPIGAGYSFSENPSEGYRTTSFEVAEDLLSFLVQFMLIFPEYQTRPLYIGGQSYAAKFVISLASEIHLQFSSMSSSFIPLKGIFLEAPMINPSSQMTSMLTAMYNLGAFTLADLRMYTEVLHELYTQFKSDTLPEHFKLSNLMYSFLPYKLNHLTPKNFVTGEGIHHGIINYYMSMERVKRGLNVGVNTTFSNFNIKVFNEFGHDFFTSYEDELGVLMSNYKVLVYSGDYDITTANSGIEDALMRVNWSRSEEYEMAPRSVWLSQHNRLSGYYTRVSQFCRVIVHGAGHYISKDQPKITTKLISDFIQHGCVFGVIKEV